MPESHMSGANRGISGYGNGLAAQPNQKRLEFCFQVSDFNLAATLESGQVFGFTKNDFGEYEGALFGAPVKLKQERNRLVAATLSESGISEAVLKNYFDLKRDLTPVYQMISDDSRLAPVLGCLKGLRVIRQEPWEALACFIISSNNNIKRIQLIRRNVSLAYSKTAFRFPEAAEIAKAGEAALRKLGLGYRAPFLFKAAKRVCEDKRFLTDIRTADYQTAKLKLLELMGVG